MEQLIWAPLQTKLSELPELERSLTVAQSVEKFNMLGACATPESYANAIGCDLENQSYRASYVPKYPTKDWNASSCALTVRSLIKHLGCEHPSIASPYKPGTAMQSLYSLAVATKSLGNKSEIPTVGSFYYLTDLSPGSQHIETAVSIDKDNVVTAIAGGQVFDPTLKDPATFGGGTDIIKVRRKFVVQDKDIYAISIPRNPNKPPTKRLVQWWIDSAKLPWTANVKSPILY